MSMPPFLLTLILFWPLDPYASFQAWFGESPVALDDLVCGLCRRKLFLVAQVRGVTVKQTVCSSVWTVNACVDRLSLGV